MTAQVASNTTRYDSIFYRRVSLMFAPVEPTILLTTSELHEDNENVGSKR